MQKNTRKAYVDEKWCQHGANATPADSPGHLREYRQMQAKLTAGQTRYSAQGVQAKARKTIRGLARTTQGVQAKAGKTEFWDIRSQHRRGSGTSGAASRSF